MAAARFDLAAFLSQPSVEQLDVCRKDDLLQLATHFGISVPKTILKRVLKPMLSLALVERGIIVVPELPEKELMFPVAGSAAKGEVTPTPDLATDVSDTDRAGERPATPLTLPRFDPSSDSSAHSLGGARLKVRLARLQYDAQDRERQMRFQLEVRRMEIEADQAVRLRTLELESANAAMAGGAVGSAGTVSLPHSSKLDSVSPGFDVSKNIALVPFFREAEVDSYFQVFERIALALKWPPEVWSLLLQCKLQGKAQEAIASLSVEDSTDYETVKSAILRIYELVPELTDKSSGHIRNQQRKVTQSLPERKLYSLTGGLRHLV
ncbi:uncharacterized protein LOC144410342 [Gasterosteus aculeatus]